jgi:hypothetical protein
LIAMQSMQSSLSLDMYLTTKLFNCTVYDAVQQGFKR